MPRRKSGFFDIQSLHDVFDYLFRVTLTSSCTVILFYVARILLNQHQMRKSQAGIITL